MIRIAVDYDGTIADTNLVKSKWLKRNMNIDIPAWRCDRTLCETIIGREKYNEMAKDVYGRELSLGASEVRGAREGLKQLKELGSVFVLTARDPEMLQWAEIWLAEHGVRDDVEQVIANLGQPKLKLCQEYQINVLIDDDQRHVFEAEPGDIRRILLKNGMDGTLDVPEYVTLCRDWGEVTVVVKKWVFGDEM